MLDMRKDFMMIKLCNIYDTMASMYLRHEVLILNKKNPIYLPLFPIQINSASLPIILY